MRKTQQDYVLLLLDTAHKYKPILINEYKLLISTQPTTKNNFFIVDGWYYVHYLIQT